MTRLKEESSQFFHDMEENIRRKFVVPARYPSNELSTQGYYVIDYSMSSAGDVMFAGDANGKNDNKMDYLGVAEPFKDRPVPFGARGRLPSSSTVPVPRMIRTISTIDGKFTVA